MRPRFWPALFTLWVILSISVGIPPASAAGRAKAPPSVPTLARRHAGALCRVYGLDGSTASAFFVGSEGIAVSVLEAAAAASGRAVLELPSGERRSATILARDPETGLSALRATAEEEGAPLGAVETLRLAAHFAPSTERWLIGLSLSSEGEPEASLGGFFALDEQGVVLDLPLGPGAAVLDDEQHLAAVVLRYIGRGRVRAVDVGAVRRLLHRAADEMRIARERRGGELPAAKR